VTGVEVPSGSTALKMIGQSSSPCPCSVEQRPHTRPQHQRKPSGRAASLRQLDGSRASFDQLAEIVDAVGDRIDVLMDGGVQRGSHVLKALSVGAKAVGIGRYYLYPLAAAGQAGVERALGLMRTEIERDMKRMGCTAFSQLSRDNLRFR
jgi:isopentenyl diphosphate isomerase/L-lactate dehydrogenase-like FMN-dependent dehydrogenase